MKQILIRNYDVSFTYLLTCLVMQLAISYFLRLALCGGPLALPSGTFRSPGYPRNYPDDIKCIWTITVPPGSTLELEFRFFETEKW